MTFREHFLLRKKNKKKYQFVIPELALRMAKAKIRTSSFDNVGPVVQNYRCHQLTSGLRKTGKIAGLDQKLRILDRFQTPQNANKLVQQVCALNPIFPQPTNFHKSMMSKKSQTVKSSQTDNVRAPFKCDIMVVKRL